MIKKPGSISRFFGRWWETTPGADQPGGASDGHLTLPNPELQSETEYPPKSPGYPPPVLFPDGIKVLHDPPDATVDICFVHGLTGGRDSTWTAYGESTPWPKKLLPPRLSTARVLTYGYDAYGVRTSVASSNRLINHAANLLTDLTTDRASVNASSRPLIFVAHSLGGIVCKEAILLSRNDPEAHIRDVFNCTKGIVFMGTPHKGSWMADWAKIPASALGLIISTNRPLLEILETDNQFLESIQTRFWSMVRELREAGRPFEVTCFFEELPLPVVGAVVSRQSATLEGYRSLSIHANHRDMVRFSSAEDNGFKRLLGELIRWTSQIRDSAASQAIPSIIGEVNKPVNPPPHNHDLGPQFNCFGGTQNNNTGSGNQFLGATFTGNVYFGKSPP